MTLSEIPYMRWAKEHGQDGEIPLTMSAVPALDWKELGLDPASLELFHYSRYGDLETLDAIAGRWGWSHDRVFFASSATHVHFCLAASVVSPGDRVLYEVPGYHPLVDSLSCFAIEPMPYVRSASDHYALPQELIRREVDAGAKLLLVTHLQNPTGVGLSEDDQRFLVDLCESTGVKVLSDEMYRPFLDPDPGPLHEQHPSILSVMGLNKVHGLPQIRVGWGFAESSQVDLARRILDATTVHNSCLSDQVASHAVGEMERLEGRARGISAKGWSILGPWLERSPFTVCQPAGGLVCFPRVVTDRFADGDVFATAALERGVNVVPGRFFGDAERVRMGFGGDPAALKEALSRLESLLGA
ncbi:MAG: pyridoxal phosphate-dependent aminotransferase [Planctomycetota bacterium]